MTAEERAQGLLFKWGIAVTDHRMNLITQAIKGAVEEEREACAKVVEALEVTLASKVRAATYYRGDLAAAIRNRE